MAPKSLKSRIWPWKCLKEKVETSGHHGEGSKKTSLKDIAFTFSGMFAYIWQSKWVGIIAMKIERTRIHFLSNIFAAIAVLRS